MPQAPFYLSVAVPAPLPKYFDYLPEVSTTMSQYQAGLRVQIPFGGRLLTGIVTDIHHSPQIDPAKLKPINKLLDNKNLLDNDLYRLCHWISSYYHQPIGECLALPWPVLLRKGQKAEISQELAWSIIDEWDASNYESGLKRAPRQQALIDHMSKTGPTLQKDLITHGFTPSVIKGLEKKGAIRSESVHSFNALTGKPIQTELPLNEEQFLALKQISETSGFAVNLLEGVTGSGKTEVYLQAIAPLISAGKDILILVPEIGLTPQTVQRFRDRFDADILLLHSQLSDRERLDAWLCAQQINHKSRGRIVIGTRSAVFTPLPHLAIIIVDEEHDQSFKQQDGVRYHGRDVAIMRAKQLGIPIILGSATPSLDSLHNAIIGKYKHLQLTQRAGHAIAPKLAIFNLKKQAQHHGLADDLLLNIQSALNKQQQVLVFINRRGFAPTLYCPDCGWTANCRQCDAKLTLHQKPPHLHCHHCDAKQALPRNCPDCLSGEIQALGAGTERLESYLQQSFSNYPVIRIDKDSTSKKSQLETIIAPVREGKPCILVGTQMLAKGHHFPKVTLVIAVNSDGGFFSSDFRAMEKSAQLLLQVAGRAGREKDPGMAIIQTEFADHPLLHLLAEQNYHSLAQALLQERHQNQLPPFTYQGLIRADSHKQQEAEHFLHLVRQVFDRVIAQRQFSGIKSLGPLPAPMELRAGRFRSQLWTNALNRKTLHQFLNEALPLVYQLKGFHRVRWSLDVDPVDNL